MVLVNKPLLRKCYHGCSYVRYVFYNFVVAEYYIVNSVSFLPVFVFISWRVSASIVKKARFRQAKIFCARLISFNSNDNNYYY